MRFTQPPLYRLRITTDSTNGCKKSAVVDTECYWAPEINKPSDSSNDKPFWIERSVYPFPSIPSCKVPLALKRSIAAHGFLNKISFNEGYLSGPKICRTNLETPCIDHKAHSLTSFPAHQSMKYRAMKLQRIREKLIDFILLTLVQLYMHPIGSTKNIQLVLKFLECSC